MARGIRKHTLETVNIVREQNPLAVGPLLGQAAMQLNISAGMMGELLGVHEQTVLRWYMGYGKPSAGLYRKMGPLLVFVLWAHQEETPPFTGSAKQRKATFAKRMKEFLAAE
jgi:hypothetical protein